MKYFHSFLFLLCFAFVSAQEKSAEQERVKLDGVVSVVGDYVILDSDIDKTIADMESQGIPTKGVT
ncbi:MAG: peptidylprolyl isomerase, partial [Flavobacteriaceae bacterium]